MRVFLVGSICCLLEPCHSLSRVLLLSKKPLQQENAHFVHGRCIAQLGSSLVPLYGFDGIPSRTTAILLADLAADSGAVGGCGVAQLGGGLVEREGVRVVGLAAKEAAT